MIKNNESLIEAENIKKEIESLKNKLSTERFNFNDYLETYPHYNISILQYYKLIKYKIIIDELQCHNKKFSNYNKNIHNNYYLINYEFQTRENSHYRHNIISEILLINFFQYNQDISNLFSSYNITFFSPLNKYIDDYFINKKNNELILSNPILMLIFKFINNLDSLVLYRRCYEINTNTHYVKFEPIAQEKHMYIMNNCEVVNE